MEGWEEWLSWEENKDVSATECYKIPSFFSKVSHSLVHSFIYPLTQKIFVEYVLYSGESMYSYSKSLRARRAFKKVGAERAKA